MYLYRSTIQHGCISDNVDERQRDEYLIGYFLDVESAGSARLLDVTQFRNPFGYKMQIATTSAGETKETVIDLVETFNWLIGLKVKHIDSQKFISREDAKARRKKKDEKCGRTFDRIG